MKRFLCGVLAALMLVVLCACGKQETATVRLSEVTHSVFYAPQYVALEQGFFSGVDFIASIHAPDAAQAQCRPQVQTLLQRGMLRQLVVLAGRETPGCIREVRAV